MLLSVKTESIARKKFCVEICFIIGQDNYRFSLLWNTVTGYYLFRTVVSGATEVDSLSVAVPSPRLLGRCVCVRSRTLSEYKVINLSYHFPLFFDCCSCTAVLIVYIFSIGLTFDREGIGLVFRRVAFCCLVCKHPPFSAKLRDSCVINKR